MGRAAREGEGPAGTAWQRALPLPGHLTHAIEPVSFAHPAEAELARILSFYRIRWLYEPTSFVLALGPDGKPAESFTPDFYLPEHQLFIEVTTMKQALVTRKNRKLRRLRELYPSVRIKLLYRRDVERLLRAFAPVSIPAGTFRLGEVIVDEQGLSARIEAIAREVAEWHRTDPPSRGGEVLPVAVVSATPGAVRFKRQLGQALAGERVPHEIDRVRVTRYRSPRGDRRVRVATSPRKPLEGRDVLIVSDLVNTGLSLAYLTAWLRRRGARRIEICTLLRRPDAALIDTPVRFVGFDVPDIPIAGFGLETTARFRRLPYLATLIGGTVDALDSLI